MWFLILAFLFWGYLIVKLGLDKFGINRYAKRNSNERAGAETFYQRYSISASEENAVKDMVVNTSLEMAKFSEKLEIIIGMKPTHPMLVWGFLAKMGKIPSQATASWYNADNPFANDHDLIWGQVEPWNKLKITDIRKARLKYLKWYDNELRVHGMEFHLMYAPCRDGETDAAGNYIYHVEDAKDIMECNNIFPTVIFWNPTRLYAPHLQGVV